MVYNDMYILYMYIYIYIYINHTVNNPPSQTNSNIRNEVLTGTCRVARRSSVGNASSRLLAVASLESERIRPSVRPSVAGDTLADAHLNHSTLGGPRYSSRLRLTMKQSN